MKIGQDFKSSLRVWLSKKIASCLWESLNHISVVYACPQTRTRLNGGGRPAGGGAGGGAATRAATARGAAPALGSRGRLWPCAAEAATLGVADGEEAAAEEAAERGGGTVVRQPWLVSFRVALQWPHWNLHVSVVLRQFRARCLLGVPRPHFKQLPVSMRRSLSIMSRLNWSGAACVAVHPPTRPEATACGVRVATKA